MGRMCRYRLRGRFTAIKLAAILLVVCFCGLFLYFELKVDPFMREFTTARCRQLMTDAFDQAVSDKMAELNLTYEDLVCTSYSQSGVIQSVNTNVVTVNNLKSAVTDDISQKLEDYYEFAIDFPLGSATGSEFLSGEGPEITFNSIVTGSVASDFRSEFESGGVNQTIHRLYIDLKGQLIVVVGGEQEPMELETSVLVGETVIVGDVPDLYTGALQK